MAWSRRARSVDRPVVTASRPEVLLGLAGGATAIAGVVGLTGLLITLTALVQLTFVVYLLRHALFALAAGAGAAATKVNAEDSIGLVAVAGCPAVSVLVACHNEQSVAADLVTALQRLRYPPGLAQFVLVDDGSTDATADLLESHSAGDRRFLVLRRPAGGAGGKSGALNAALPHATGDVIVVFDADHQPEPDVLVRLAGHFRDPTVGAVQGRCRIRNPHSSVLSRLVAIDYAAGYLVNEYGRHAVYGLPAYGGANCAVRRDLLVDLGGWNENSVTEDTDLTVRVMLSGFRVTYDIKAVDTEEAVETLHQFWRQRYRWARGHQQVCRDYRRAVLCSRRLSRRDRVELLMFLFVFHVPVVSALGLVLLVAWLVHPLAAVTSIQAPLFVLWTLLFLGPLLELGCGMLLSGVSRRAVSWIPLFIPLFVVSIALCAKAWLDGVLGRRYAWVKTARAGDAVVLQPRPAHGELVA